MSNYKHIVFDLGGVVIELGESPIPESYFSKADKITLKEWFSLPEAHEFERGRVDSNTFAQKFINDFDLDISIEKFIQLFSKWPRRVYPGAEGILSKLSQTYRLSVLSNCNEIHWPIMKYDFEILKYFENHFSSHIIGMTKPDPLVFTHLVDELKTEPGEILFFDDNEQNVKAAEIAGIKGVQVDGFNEVKEFLISNKMLNMAESSQ